MAITCARARVNERVVCHHLRRDVRQFTCLSGTKAQTLTLSSPAARCAPPPCGQGAAKKKNYAAQRQYLYFCTSKASKLRFFIFILKKFQRGAAHPERTLHTRGALLRRRRRRFGASVYEGVVGDVVGLRPRQLHACIRT